VAAARRPQCRVDVTAAFTGTIGPNPIGGRVERVEID
jgi:hypothetical protein